MRGTGSLGGEGCQATSNGEWHRCELHRCNLASNLRVMRGAGNAFPSENPGPSETGYLMGQHSRRRRNAPGGRVRRDETMHGTFDPDAWVMHTDPGCDAAVHRLEILGAMMLLADGECPVDTRPQVMECGCLLTLRRAVPPFDEMEPW